MAKQSPSAVNPAYPAGRGSAPKRADGAAPRRRRGHAAGARPPAIGAGARRSGFRGILLSAALLLGAFAGPALSQELVWRPFDKGLKDAAALKKYAFVDVYTDWCGY